MLLRLLLTGNISQALLMLSLTLPAILLCLSVHEMSHGAMAYALGDRTAYALGRLTLNPFAHIDPMGFLFMLLFGFGWAKPVPVAYQNLTKLQNRRLAMGLVALAGPLSNFAFAFLMYILLMLGSTVPIGASWYTTLILFLNYTASLSIGLGAFNLLPVYPLDGSHIFGALLPQQWYYQLADFCRRYQTILTIVLLYLLFSVGLEGVISYIDRVVRASAFWLLRSLGWI